MPDTRGPLSPGSLPASPSPAPLDPVLPPSLEAVGLQDCDVEPIHTPGHVQPHGALIVLDRQRLVRGWSANVPQLLQLRPVLQQPLPQAAWPAAIAACIDEVLNESLADGFAPVRLAGPEPITGCDVLVHAHAGRVLVEFERVAPGGAASTDFLIRSHRLLDVIRRQPDQASLLETVVSQLRDLTAFDRVMAYRFLPDDSGEVVAEARRPDLEALLGMRYPASDIPAQARRLYVLSTLRLIADVADEPVAVLGHPEDPPLDMSYGVLRSVSPIHVEYLRNMGVHASMSISIVIDGRLWGLIACHHYSPHRVPFALRAVCDLVAQVLAAQVARLESAVREEVATRASQVRAQLAQGLRQHDDLLAGFVPLMGQVRQLFKADALIVSHGGQHLVEGEVSAAQVRAILGALPAHDVVERHRRADWPEPARAAVGPWVGLLGVAFDLASHGWVLALRCEQEQTVRWGGAPEKVYAQGPRGPRLTPRGSFAEWRQTVAGSAEPWAPALSTAARHMQSDLQREVLSRFADVERARVQMLAMLSHDLRDPLNTIRVAAGLLERSAHGAIQQQLGSRIKTSSGRMERMVAHLLDFHRIRAGGGLEVRPTKGDLIASLKDVVDESCTAHPGFVVELDAPASATLNFDADRLAQALGNLLGNARHHGDPAHGVTVRAGWATDGAFSIQVRNAATPLPPELAANLFQAFKRPVAEQGPGRHRGLGLGLFIAHQIVLEHDGRLAYRYEAPEVVFEILLPGPA